MRRLLLATVLLTLLTSACSSKSPSPSATEAVEASHAVKALIEKRLTWTGLPYRVQIAGEAIHAEYSLPRFYKLRQYRPAWFDSSGVSPAARKLLGVIRESEAEGLSPEAFHESALKTLLGDLERRKQMKIDADPEREADAELLLTDAYLVLGGQLQSGRVKPKMPGYEWFFPRTNQRDMVASIEQAIATNTIVESVKDLLPRSAEYARLRSAYGEYRKLAARGGWPLIAPGPALKPGMRDKRVLLLRKRLAVTGDAVADGAVPDARVYDAALTDAVRRFQARHGNKPDGIVGGGTLAALNVSAPKRLRQLKANLERWRWLPRELGRRYVAVNIADYHMRVIEEDQAVLDMPVVVGTQYRHTPVFTGTMTHVILNPTWLVPNKLAVEDILPKVKKSPAYLSENGFRVLEKNGRTWNEIDASTVDWEQVTDENFSYRLEQSASDSNALGRVKFMFPNQFGVYLHDTPARNLFSKRVRSFSSGCIRLERPMELLNYVLKGQDVTAELATGETKKIDLTEPLTVHILYQTAWVDAEGLVQFRPDIYGKDELLDQFL